MALKIVSALDPIEVEYPVFLIIGQPGAGKSTLGYSMADPLLLDFDKGAHRAKNRRDTLQIDSWADAAELTHAEAQLQPYASLVVDTAGRCLDVLSTDIGKRDGKLARSGGALTQQGFGVLKSDFTAWVRSVRAMRKGLLLLAHDKEDKDGDVRVVRADVTGGSYGEIMKIADFVGFLRLEGKKRVLDFTPTDRWPGKNPAGWDAFEVPPIAQAGDFMATLYEQGKAALGGLSEASAAVARRMFEWKLSLETICDGDGLTRAIEDGKQFTSEIEKRQAFKALQDRAKAIGFLWSKDQRAFVRDEAKAPGEPATEPKSSAQVLAEQLAKETTAPIQAGVPATAGKKPSGRRRVAEPVGA